VLDEVVAALAQRVPEEDRPLGEIDTIAVPRAPGGGGIRVSRAGDQRDVLRLHLLHTLRVVLLRNLHALLEQDRDLGRDVVALRELLGYVHRGDLLRWIRSEVDPYRGLALSVTAVDGLPV